MKTPRPSRWLLRSFALVALAIGLQPMVVRAQTAAPPCAVGSPPPASEASARTIIAHLEQHAEAANHAGEHLRVAFLLLQAERHLPLCAAAARADRVTRAISALRRAAADPAHLDTAVAVVETFLVDIEASHGARTSDLEDVAAMRDLLRDLRDQRGASAPPATTIVPPAPVVPPPAAATNPEPVARARPLLAARPTPAELAAHHRRTLGLAAGLGVSAGLTLAAAGAAIGTRVPLLEGSALHHDIQAAAEASTADQDPDNDIPHDASVDICRASQASRAAGVGDPAVADLCGHRDNLLRASTGLWISSGVLAATTAVLATLLAVHRRHPIARFHAGPIRGGAAVLVNLRF